MIEVWRLSPSRSHFPMVQSGYMGYGLFGRFRRALAGTPIMAKGRREHLRSPIFVATSPEPGNYQVNNPINGEYRQAGATIYDMN